MKIVVLDGYCANPGDMSWERFKEFGEVEVYERTPADKAAQRIGDAEAALTNKVAFDETLLSQTKNLKYIGIMATGYNIIDIEAANRHGVAVCNVPGYSTNSVAQEVFAFILQFANNTARYSDWVYSGGWQNCEDFSRLVVPVFELAGKTIGIIGYGAIGRRVAEIAAAFGMRVLAFSRSLNSDNCPNGVIPATVETILRESDFVTLHCPLNPQSSGMINRQSLSLMKRSAYLINTARGGLVDEAALCEALNSGAIAGAGLDVVSAEPIDARNPLLLAKNCVITPHVAWATTEARCRLMDALYENLRAFLSGSPINRVC